MEQSDEILFSFKTIVNSRYHINRNSYTFCSEYASENRRGQGRRFDPSMMQAAGRIYGSVVDAQSSQPVEYANVVVFKWRDSTVAYGIVTNDKGNFEINKMMPGRYFMKVSYIGYSTKRFDSLMVMPNKMESNFGVIKLNPKNVNMNEVVVQGRETL